MYETYSVPQLEREWETDQNSGLAGSEAEKRLKKYGENVLKKGEEQTVWGMILEQLNEPMIFILFMAAAISMLLREFSDTLIIFIVIVLNTAVGVIQEGKAKRAIEELNKLTAPAALVKRDGQYQEIPASQLVPGDVVKIEAGMQIPADIRLTQVRGLQVNESAFTGESMAVEKCSVSVVGDSVPVSYTNMVYMSTEAMRGQGEGIVTATGMGTQLGRIAGLINETEKEMTPLQKRLGSLGKVLSILAVILCAALFLMGVIQHRDLLQMLLLAISLAVAAIPEGLPAVVTIVLALGVSRMAKANTIIRKLPAVETLGSVGVVCSDKTGTLTENKMTVVQFYGDGHLSSADQLDQGQHQVLLEGFMLCNDSAQGAEDMGDPTELALLSMGRKLGLKKEELERKKPRKDEIPFDSHRKYMVTLHRDGNHNVLYVKGACDRILGKCKSELFHGVIRPLSEIQKMKIREAMESMAKDALRVLALAMKPSVSELTENHLEDGLVFVGMVGMMDPPREGARESVEALHRAGVQVAMITGDHQETAYAIGRSLRIASHRDECISGEELEQMDDKRLRDIIGGIRIFARVTPEHKVRIVRAFKGNEKIVAMTGDGVNDAPSLHAADIGIAMGRSGTDVAKNAADMVLTDDNFSTIEKAMEEGRSIYVNIQKSILFLLSSNFGEIITMFAAVLLGMPTPLKATHILWVNLITDSLPALALGVDKNDRKKLMEEPPRKAQESLFANGGWFLTIFYGMVIGGITLFAYTLGGQTYAFTVLGVSQLFHAIGMRDVNRSVFRMNHLENLGMIGAFCVGLGLQAVVTEIPWFVEAFQTVQLDLFAWLQLLGLSAIPLLMHELFVFARKLR
ncbi:MAG: cation-translocating P-type ATPase [Lachnospiraceae bacterium]|jgi:Ca2+-transporting ATPase